MTPTPRTLLFIPVVLALNRGALHTGSSYGCVETAAMFRNGVMSPLEARVNGKAAEARAEGGCE